MRRRPIPRLTLAPAPPVPPQIEDTPSGVRVWAQARGGGAVWEVRVDRGRVPDELTVVLAWELRVPVDEAEALAREVLARLGAG